MIRPQRPPFLDSPFRASLKPIKPEKVAVVDFKRGRLVYAATFVPFMREYAEFDRKVSRQGARLAWAKVPEPAIAESEGN